MQLGLGVAGPTARGRWVCFHPPLRVAERQRLARAGLRHRRRATASIAECDARRNRDLRSRPAIGISLINAAGLAPLTLGPR